MLALAALLLLAVVRRQARVQARSLAVGIVLVAAGLAATPAIGGRENAAPAN